LAQVMPVMGRVSCLVSDIWIPFPSLYNIRYILAAKAIQNQRQMTNGKRAKWPIDGA